MDGGDGAYLQSLTKNLEFETLESDQIDSPLMDESNLGKSSGFGGGLAQDEQNGTHDAASSLMFLGKRELGGSNTLVPGESVLHFGGEPQMDELGVSQGQTQRNRENV